MNDAPLTSSHPPEDPAATRSPVGRAMTEEFQRTLAPTRPNDDLSFDELEKRYNFRLTSDRRGVIARLLHREFERIRTERPGPVRVLDIGCGRGIGRNAGYTRAIGANIDEFWGIEPDQSAAPPEGVFDHTLHAPMESADLPESYFDVCYSVMVMEHVADPEAFLKAVARCLKPGGVYLFTTPNGGHYFTITASLLHRLHLDEAILRLLLGETKDDYHYPVQYKANSARRIRRLAARTGFSEARFAYVEAEGPTGYMRGPLRPLLHLLRCKRRIIHHRAALLTLIGRMRRAD